MVPFVSTFIYFSRNTRTLHKYCTLVWFLLASTTATAGWRGPNSLKKQIWPDVNQLHTALQSVTHTHYTHAYTVVCILIEFNWESNWSCNELNWIEFAHCLYFIKHVCCNSRPLCSSSLHQFSLMLQRGRCCCINQFSLITPHCCDTIQK